LLNSVSPSGSSPTLYGHREFFSFGSAAGLTNAKRRISTGTTAGGDAGPFPLAVIFVKAFQYREGFYSPRNDHGLRYLEESLRHRETNSANANII
jgi:hypothetical protein